MRKLIIFICLIIGLLVPSDTAMDRSVGFPKVVLVTIDGVRWQDVFDQHAGIGDFKPTSRELLPNIYHYFVDNGIAVGNKTPAFVEGPAHVSMPGYTEIVRGYPSLDCRDNYCKQTRKPTIMTEFKGSATVIAGWEPIAKVFDDDGVAINIGRRIRNHEWWMLGIPNTDNRDDSFDDEEYRDDTDTVTVAQNYIRREQPNFLWVSLGDTDEYAHMNNMLFYWVAMHYADQFVGELMTQVEPNTVVIICPDHGRSDDFMNHHWEPASGRVWMMIGGNVAKAGMVAYDRNVYLSDIYPTIMDVAKGVKSPRSLLNYER